MKIILFIIVAVATLFGFSVFAGAKSAIHEIAALVSLLIAVVAISSIGIIEAINKQGNNEEDKKNHSNPLKTLTSSKSNTKLQKSKISGSTHIVKP